MYLRTTRRQRADGSEVVYYQLAENVWDAKRGCAVARIVYNFGRADQLDGDALRRLAQSILRVVGEKQVSPDGGAIEGLRLLDAWPYGGVWVLEQLWKELGIDVILKKGARRRATGEAFERALFAMVANRALEPYSKLYCWEQWLREEVFLPTASEIGLERLYRAMDFLEEHKTEVEKAVYFAMADLMNADVDLIFYDTTSLHFEVDEEDGAELHKQGRSYPAQRKRGHSKNGRTDAPQIVVGLAVTRDGLPVRSWVFPGNTADVTTVKRVREDLRGWRLGRCVFVGDAGMNSEDNRHELALGNGKYILAARLRAGDEVTKEVLTRPGRYAAVRENLRAKEVIVGDGERRRRYVVCHNPVEEKRQAEHRKKLLVELEAELATMEQKPGRHSKHTCELLTSQRFGRYLRQTKTGLVRIDRAAVADAERYDGKWVITSNDDTLSAEDLALGYKQLLRVEQCWRQLKSGLGMRPVFHYRPWRIQAHISIAVLGLLLERVAEIRAGDTWRNIVAELDRVKVVEYEHAGARVLQTTELPPSVTKLLVALKVAEPPRLHSIRPAPARGAAPDGETAS
jgi:transposase